MQHSSSQSQDSGKWQEEMGGVIVSVIALTMYVHELAVEFKYISYLISSKSMILVGLIYPHQCTIYYISNNGGSKYGVFLYWATLQ